MVFSLTFRVIRWLIGLAVVLSRRDLSNEIELLVLRHENAVLRLWGAETGLAWLS
jgi:putative transposase